LKKPVIFAVIAVVLLAAGGFWFIKNHDSVEPADPMQAIPTSAALVVSYPNMNETWGRFKEQPYATDLLAISELHLFFTRNMWLDSLLTNDQQIREMLQGAMFWSSYHQTNSDSLHIFHAISTNNYSDSRTWNVLGAILSGFGTVTEQKIGEIGVKKLVVAKPYMVAYFATYRGLVLASSSLDLMRTSIAQLNGAPSLLQDPYFQKLAASAGKNVDADVYINYRHLPEYLAGYLKPGVGKAPSMLGSLADWTELDVNLKEDGFSFNGFSYVNDSLPQYLRLFLDQKPQSINFPQVLPSNTASFTFFGIEDAMSFSTNYRKLLQDLGTLSHSQARLDSLNAAYDVDFEQNLIVWMGNEFGICVTEPPTSNFSERSFAVFKSRSSDLANRILGDLATRLCEKNSTRPETHEINGSVITKLEMEGALAAIFGDGFEHFQNPYFTVVNDYVIFGSSEVTLEEFVRYVQADRTLAKDLAFSDFAQNLGSSFNVFTYHHIARSHHVLDSYLNKRTIAALERNRDAVRKFEAVGSQITSSGNAFYSNIHLRYNPEWQSEEQSVWEAKMEAPAIGKPVFVKNHLSGETEVLVQDETNKLYLFNKFGQELFRIELSEPMMSTPVQVDAQKNGQLQYVFNTKNSIQLIDRDGKSLPGFPIELGSPASTELAVIEYDKSRDYRLLIACKNKRIYNYDVKGKQTSGWQHEKSTDLTVHPFKHMVVGNKDYLVTGEESGKVHLLDRRGKNRVTVKSKVVPSKNNHLQPYRSSENAFTGVYITDEKGLIHRISLDGNVQEMDLGRYSPDHRFLVADLDKDGGPEFIFIDLNLLQVFNYKKQKVFEHRIDPSATEPLLIDLGEPGLGIGFCFNDSEQLILFDAGGNMMNGFPLSGTTLFDMRKEGEEFVVVSGYSGTSIAIQSVR